MIEPWIIGYVLAAWGWACVFVVALLLGMRLSWPPRVYTGYYFITVAGRVDISKRDIVSVGQFVTTWLLVLYTIFWFWLLS